MSVASMLNRVVRSRAHVGRERSLSMTPKQQWRVMNLYPPFLGIGLRIYGWTDDWTEVRVKLLLTPFNRNNHGTAFGGSIGAMSDAFNALLLIGQLGPDYLVWDTEAQVRYVSPGAGTVYATFRVTPEEAEDVRREAASGAKVLRWFDTDLTLKDGTVVAHARRQVYVRLKRGASRPDLERAESAR